MKSLIYKAKKYTEGGTGDSQLVYTCIYIIPLESMYRIYHLVVLCMKNSTTYTTHCTILTQGLCICWTMDIHVCILLSKYMAYKQTVLTECIFKLDNGHTCMHTVI